jgi:hypothetical protein
MSDCTPRRRYAEREAAEQAKAAAVEAARWKDPFTPLERWFSRLPNTFLEEKCHCGSGKPLLYWSPEDGDGCKDCAGSLHVYIPEAVMYNVMDKFGITGDVRAQVYAQIEKSREER